MASELSVKITTCPQPGIRVVEISGELDESNVDNIRSTIEGILQDINIKIIIFHLRGLSFINSKGIGYLVSVHTHLAKDKRHLVLVEAQEPVMDVINLIGLPSIIPYYGTLEEALKSS